MRSCTAMTSAPSSATVSPHISSRTAILALQRLMCLLSTGSILCFANPPGLGRGQHVAGKSNIDNQPATEHILALDHRAVNGRNRLGVG